MNCPLFLHPREPFVLQRANSYIAVLTDHGVVKGKDSPLADSICAQ
jgi:tRNA U34 5-carboxymethylaminomethyl modifying enzyme MnmG/GidA